MSSAAQVFSDFDLSRWPCIVAAVSGGGDSLALMLLLKSWLDGLDNAPNLLAVTVDHGLRAESAVEAEMVASLCRRLGIEHRIKRWRGPKPGSGVIAAARDARHRLLAEAARDAATDLVMTGHTLNDQAETVAMRRDRRAEGDGLSGIAPATLYDSSVWFARPLIGMRREALRDFLRARCVEWVEDPTNQDHRFERARVRAGLSETEVERLAGEAQRAGGKRAALSARAATLLGRHATRPAPGLFRLDPETFAPQAGDTEAAVLALRMLLALAGGAEHPPDATRGRALCERLSRGRLRATLSRAVIDVRANGVWIHREARGLPEIGLTAAAARWDGRWRVAPASEHAALRIGPLGPEQARDASSAGAEVPQSLERAALSVEPALFEGEVVLGLLSDPQTAMRGVEAAPIVAPYASYLPSFDFSLATALRRLVGLPTLPVPPWKDHIDA